MFDLTSTVSKKQPNNCITSIFMLAAAFYFERTINWTPGHDCSPYTISVPLFYLLFLSILLHIRRRRRPANDVWVGQSFGRRTILAADPIQTGDQSNTGPCLLLHSLLIGATLAAASFFDRNYCRSSLMFQSGDSFPFLLFLRKTTVGRSIDRTWDRLLHPFEHRSGLLLHPFEHGPGLLLHPF